MAIEIIHIVWKNEHKKTEGFFIKLKNGFRRVYLSAEDYTFTEDFKISEAEVTVNGTLVKVHGGTK